MSYRDAEGIEGPYWDFSEAIRWVRDERNDAAWLCARYLHEGRLDDAERWAEQAAQYEARRARISARYDAVKDQPVTRWIGWDRL